MASHVGFATMARIHQLQRSLCELIGITRSSVPSGRVQSAVAMAIVSSSVELTGGEANVERHAPYAAHAFATSSADTGPGASVGRLGQADAAVVSTRPSLGTPCTGP